MARLQRLPRGNDSFRRLGVILGLGFGFLELGGRPCLLILFAVRGSDFIDR
jgi:hypothetical protein